MADSKMSLFHSKETQEKFEYLYNEVLTSGLLSSVRRLLTFLKTEGIMYKVVLGCMVIGKHPANRDGYGVTPAKVHELIDGFVNVGYSCDDAENIGGEIDPETAHSDTQWNIDAVTWDS